MPDGLNDRPALPDGWRYFEYYPGKIYIAEGTHVVAMFTRVGSTKKINKPHWMAQIVSGNGSSEHFRHYSTFEDAIHATMTLYRMGIK